MQYGRFLLGAAVSALSLAAGMTPSQAQTSTQTASALETVVVTARKREENAQSVPISINAFSQDDLNKLSVLTIQDLKTVSVHCPEVLERSNRVERRPEQ